MTPGLRCLTSYSNRIFAFPPQIYSFSGLSHLRQQQYHHLFSHSSLNPGNELLFHSHIPSTDIQYILPGAVILHNPGRNSSLDLPASISCHCSPLYTQQSRDGKTKDVMLLCYTNWELPTTFITKSDSDLHVVCCIHLSLSSLPLHTLFLWPGTLFCPINYSDFRFNSPKKGLPNPNKN